MNKKESRKLKVILLEHLRKTPIVEAACQKAGISRQTFYRWKFEDAEFAKEIEKAIEDGRMLVSDLSESQVLSLIRDKNWQAISFWLKHHHPSYKTRIQIEGSLQMPQEELTPEQEETVKEALRLASISAVNEAQSTEKSGDSISKNNQQNHEQNNHKEK
jgi:hypothetical protein